MTGDEIFENFFVGIMTLGVIVTFVFLCILAYNAPLIFVVVSLAVLTTFVIGKLVNDRFNILG